MLDRIARFLRLTITPPDKPQKETTSPKYEVELTLEQVTPTTKSDVQSDFDLDSADMTNVVQFPTPKPDRVVLDSRNPSDKISTELPSDVSLEDAYEVGQCDPLTHCHKLVKEHGGDVRDCLIQFHNEMVSLASHLLGQGYTPEEIFNVYTEIEIARDQLTELGVDFKLGDPSIH